MTISSSGGVGDRDRDRPRLNDENDDDDITMPPPSLLFCGMDYAQMHNERDGSEW